MTQQRGRQRQYWWLVAHGQEGEEDTLIFGSDKSEEDARQKGLMMLPDTNFEIRKFPTRDLGSASAMYRGRKLEVTHSLKQAKQHLVHEKGLAQRQRREDHKQKRRGESIAW